MAGFALPFHHHRGMDLKQRAADDSGGHGLGVQAPHMVMDRFLTEEELYGDDEEE